MSQKLLDALALLVLVGAVALAGLLLAPLVAAIAGLLMLGAGLLLYSWRYGTPPGGEGE